ncbi:MAG TPA: sulfatase-like hydrolase/transferase [Lacipirellulaceae bacterium]|jgi:arylsulfatase A-like enzyme|nr:sulfatase-like hydrolase/transferase [Lacipirellulaceae bacterium]
MPESNILVVVVDGLRAAALGGYGNTTYPTPALDQFAAEASVLDFCFAPSDDLPAVYRAMWQSCHPARPLAASSPHGSSSLPEILAGTGFQTKFITDEKALLGVGAANHFHECSHYEGGDDYTAAIQASDVSHTQIGRLFAAAAECIVADQSDRANESRRLLWVHSRGMYGPWDAPREYQQSLLDDGASAIACASAPRIELCADDDPDIAFRYATAYAAQVFALDFAWQVVEASLAEATDAGQPWCVVLMGSRGFPLGENGLIGGTDSKLTSAQLHVPCMIRLPEGRGRLVRCDTLVSHLDVLPTLLEVAGPLEGVRFESDGASWIQYVQGTSVTDRGPHLAANDSVIAIRTPRWCFRASRKIELGASAREDDAEADPAKPELFVRPDDRWEANDVSKLCLDVVDELQSLLQSTLDHFAMSMGQK